MILVDTADLEALGQCLAYPSIRGFTTNPTLVTRSAGVEQLSLPQYHECILRLIRALPHVAPQDDRCREIFLQGVGSAEQIVSMAREWREQLDPARWRLWIKLLPDRPSINAIPTLTGAGVRTLVTAVNTLAQARVSLDAGADGVAVYVGRLQRIHPEWSLKIARIAALSQRAHRTLLLASFKDLPLIESALELSDDITIPASLVPRLLDSPLSAAAIVEFGKTVAPSIGTI
jgi:transaldolase